MESQMLVSFLEKVRYGRNISQEDMIYGIISIRQYRRYLYGEVEIPFGVAGQLATKLGISSNKLLRDFQEENNRQRRLILSFYNAVVSRNFSLVNEYLKKIDLDQIIDQEQQMLFKSGLTMYNFFTGKITKQEMIEEQKLLVNYPNIMDNKILTDSEMIVLAKILDIGDDESIDILERFELIFLKNDFHISGDNSATMIQVVFWLAKYYGRHKDYGKTIEFCNYGIESNKKLRTLYLMEYFNYYNALSYYRTGNLTKYKEHLYEAILYLEIIPEQTRVERFYSIIKKDLDIEPLEFVHEYLGEKLKK